MKKILSTFLLLLGLGLNGCAPAVTIDPTKTTYSSQLTEISPIPKSSPTVSVVSELTTKCPETLSTLPENVVLNGRVYLTAPLIPGNAIHILDVKMDLRTGKLTPIAWPKNTQIGTYTVSPDHKRLAFWKILYSNENKQISRSIIIQDIDGNTLKEIFGDLKTWDTFYWLDNERIVIGMYGQPYVLNIFSGEDYDLSRWYSQSAGGLRTIPVWDVNGIFDSQLSRIFYIQEDGTMLLWDLEAKQILAKLDPNSRYNPGDQPKWSWDNLEIVFGYANSTHPNAGDELISVNREGKISQLTELGKYYSQASISKFSWSPDGHNIAFFFKDMSKKDDVSQLAVLNRDTLKVTNYCNLSGFMRPNIEPVWSPDGKMLLIGRVEADTKTYKTILLDLTNGLAATLIENRIPSGWMAIP